MPSAVPLKWGVEVSRLTVSVVFSNCGSLCCSWDTGSSLRAISSLAISVVGGAVGVSHPVVLFAILCGGGLCCSCGVMLQPGAMSVLSSLARITLSFLVDSGFVSLASVSMFSIGLALSRHGKLMIGFPWGSVGGCCPGGYPLGRGRPSLRMGSLRPGPNCV